MSLTYQQNKSKRSKGYRGRHVDDDVLTDSFYAKVIKHAVPKLTDSDFQRKSFCGMKRSHRVIWMLFSKLVKLAMELLNEVEPSSVAYTPVRKCFKVWSDLHMKILQRN